MTVRRARILWELHLPLLMLAQISLNKPRPDKVSTVITEPGVSYLSNFIIQAAIKRQFHKGLVTLKLALKVRHVPIFNTIQHIAHTKLMYP